MHGRGGGVTSFWPRRRGSARAAAKQCSIASPPFCAAVVVQSAAMATVNNTNLLQDLEPTRYLRTPILDVPGAVALGIALLTAAGKDLPVAAKRAAKVLRQAVVALQSDWAAQRDAGLTTEEDKRPADQRLDRAWAAVGGRLQTLAELPQTLDEASQAARLYARIFPDGLAFLRLPYERQWAQSEQRLEQLAHEELGAAVEELVGAFVLTELRDAHANYGRVLGITDAKPGAVAAPNLLEQLRVVQQAMTGYALQLVAAAHAEPELAAAVRGALRPLDDLREAQGRRANARGGGGAATTEPELEAVTPNTPVPVIVDA